MLPKYPLNVLDALIECRDRHLFTYSKLLEYHYKNNRQYDFGKDKDGDKYLKIIKHEHLIEDINNSTNNTINCVNEHFDYYVSKYDKNLANIKFKLLQIETNIEVHFSFLKLFKDRKLYEVYNPLYLLSKNLVDVYNIILKRIELYNLSDNTEILPTYIPKHNNTKVMLMYELGIFELIEFNYENMNPTHICQVIESFTGIDQDTIRQTYRAIIGERRNENPFESSKKKNEFNELKKQLNLIKKGNP